MESNGRAGMEKSLCGNGLLQGSIPPAPASHSTGECGAKLVEYLVYYRVFVRLSKVSDLRKSTTLERKSRKSPAQTAEIPVFVETISGDRFDLH